MKTLLTSIQTLLRAELTYLKDVFITPDLLVFPEESDYPMIGLLDNGDETIDREKGMRYERLKVSIGIYQAIAKPEASVIGDGADKGTLDIKDDVMDELRFVKFTGGYSYPVYIRSSKSQALETKDFEGFIALKIIDIEYPNEVVEAT